MYNFPSINKLEKDTLKKVLKQTLKHILSLLFQNKRFIYTLKGKWPIVVKACSYEKNLAVDFLTSQYFS